MTDRKVQVCVSRDGGFNYSDWREGDLGDLGEYRTRVRFNRFGSGYQFVLKERVTSPIRADWHGLVGDIESGE
jgi:hypothetical protein